MKILITGGTGFIGRKLCHYLQERHHQLTILTRRPLQIKSLCGDSVTAITDIAHLSETDAFDAIINLAGEGIADKRWSEARKQKLLDSRIGVTRQIIEFCAKAQVKPKVLLSGSAIGFYGDSGDQVLDEESTSREDFAHQLCADWEAVALEAESLGVRVCLLRTGLVLGSDGGFLMKMLPTFRLGLGCMLGEGKQWMSWIHRDDHVAIMNKLLFDESLSGVFNLTAPEPVTHKDFCQQLAKVLMRPFFLKMPEAPLRFLLGEMADLLLSSQRVLPTRIQQAGYVFKYNQLESALKNVTRTS